jgi:excisionase family DNA binding protein
MRNVPETKAAEAGATPQTDFITVREAAGLLKMSEISIRRFLTQKKLKRFKVGARTLLRSSEVLGLIRESEN